DLDTHAITEQIAYLTADQEATYAEAQSNSKLDENVGLLDDEVVGRFCGNNTVMAKAKLHYMDLSPTQ
ncbi:hypothetical protein, partial [Staphylococcus aureus]